MHDPSVQGVGAGKTRPCPAKGCDERLEHGAIYSDRCSTFCDYFDSHVHTHCTGRFTSFGMDYTNETCHCFCHREARS